MRIEYDRSVNAATIYLVHEIGQGQVKKSYHCDFKEVGGMINLAFDAEGRLLNIEVIHATTLLPKEALDQAELI